MPTANVKVEYVNEPRKNPKFGSIKTKELGYVSVPVEGLAQFAEGESCTISYSTNPKGYHNLIQKIAGTRATAPGAAYSKDNPSAAVMGMVNQFIGRGDVPLDSKSIANVINKCKAGYEMSDLCPNKPKADDDMNDEIPY